MPGDQGRGDELSVRSLPSLEKSPLMAGPQSDSRLYSGQQRMSTASSDSRRGGGGFTALTPKSGPTVSIREDITEFIEPDEESKNVWRQRAKTVSLLALFVFSAVAFAMEEEEEEEAPYFAIAVGDADRDQYGTVHVESNGAVLHLQLEAKSESSDHELHAAALQGGIAALPEQILNISLCSGSSRSPRSWEKPCGNATHVGSTWKVTLSKRGVKKVTASHTIDTEGKGQLFLSVHHTPTPGNGTNCHESVGIGIKLAIVGVREMVKYQELFAGLVLVFVYVLIIFELTHRTIAAMLGSFVALGVLSMIGKRPSLEVIVGWVDYETVMLLFGMMVLVGILAQTGVFEATAVKAWSMSGGSNWRLITFLMLITAVVSAVLDNVTTVLLMTPVTIRMCSVIGLEPKPVLMALVLFSNIGGTATAIGDPPNVLIVAKDWSTVCTSVGCESDVTFPEFTLHMFLGCILVGFVCYFQIKWMFRNEKLQTDDSPEIAQTKFEIRHFSALAKQYARGSISSRQSLAGARLAVTETLCQKVGELEELLEERRQQAQTSWADNVAEFARQSPIKDKPLLIKCAVTICATILLFFMVSIPGIHLDLGWVACLGAITLLLWTNPHNLEELLEKVEWGTLLFFASLFILMEALAELGLIDAIGDVTADVIRGVPDASRQTVAIIVVLWVSALVSAFIDNIPFTTVMIPVISKLAEDDDMGLKLRPLIWALAFGACLGGNGTLIGASANVVCAGMAEQAGITLSFNYFFSFGFPVMLVSVTAATGYLMLCHPIAGWNL
eukprot:TRINITY_DN542_c1_g7_i1.p1 TRINITY_DN542_c1_g7~~TRINITY_DN542_c1_g7_i1.p1  ORF type:complete len:812 (+),score=319.95 TRINITY_DN542_c1_g7_i1:84-2438(+)